MMGGNERDFARCSQMWASARNFRKFRTAQQDEADRKRAARIEVAVSALVAALSFVAALIVGYATASYGLASGWAQLAAMATCVLTFTVASKLADAWLNSRKAGER